MDSGTPDVFKLVEFSEALTNTGSESPPANRDWSSASGSDMGIGRLVSPTPGWFGADRTSVPIWPTEEAQKPSVT